jgi:hypothetical protein
VIVSGGVTHRPIAEPINANDYSPISRAAPIAAKRCDHSLAMQLVMEAGGLTIPADPVRYGWIQRNGGANEQGTADRRGMKHLGR